MAVGAAAGLAAGLKTAVEAGLPLGGLENVPAAVFAQMNDLSVHLHDDACPTWHAAAAESRLTAGTLGTVLPSRTATRGTAQVWLDVCLNGTRVRAAAEVFTQLGLVALRSDAATALERMSLRWALHDPHQLMTVRSHQLVRVLAGAGSVWTPTRVRLPEDLTVELDPLLEFTEQMSRRVNAVAAEVAQRWPVTAVASSIVECATPAPGDRELVWVPVRRPLAEYGSDYTLSLLVASPVVASDPVPGSVTVVQVNSLTYQAASAGGHLGGAATPRRGMTRSEWDVVFALLRSDRHRSLEDALAVACAAVAA